MHPFKATQMGVASSRDHVRKQTPRTPPLHARNHPRSRSRKSPPLPSTGVAGHNAAGKSSKHAACVCVQGLYCLQCATLLSIQSRKKVYKERGDRHRHVFHDSAVAASRGGKVVVVGGRHKPADRNRCTQESLQVGEVGGGGGGEPVGQQTSRSRRRQGGGWGRGSKGISPLRLAARRESLRVSAEKCQISGPLSCFNTRGGESEPVGFHFFFQSKS